MRNSRFATFSVSPKGCVWVAPFPFHAFTSAPTIPPTRMAEKTASPKPKKLRSDLVDRLQYVGLRLVSMVLHSFPVNTNLKTAELLGDFMYRVDRRHRQ